MKVDIVGNSRPIFYIYKQNRPSKSFVETDSTLRKSLLVEKTWLVQFSKRRAILLELF